MIVNGYDGHEVVTTMVVNMVHVRSISSSINSSSVYHQYQRTREVDTVVGVDILYELNF